MQVIYVQSYMQSIVFYMSYLMYMQCLPAKYGVMGPYPLLPVHLRAYRQGK